MRLCSARPGYTYNGQMWYICPRCRGIPNRGCESSSDAWDDDAVFQGAGWVNNAAVAGYSGLATVFAVVR